MTDAGIVVRKCRTLEEFQLCVTLQREIWQEADLEVEPATAFVVAANTGRQVLGAFDGARLAGYTLAVVGVRDGVIYLHSHMTGVHADYRDRGVGRLLKLFQRDEALSRGIRLIRWTFDPLEMRNGRFNLNRLGAICRKYLPNFYGVTSSPLHRGLDTDRLLAEWHLDSPRVVAATAGAPIPMPEYFAVVEMPAEPGTVAGPSATAGQPVDQPADVRQLAALQQRLRDEFTKYFQRGYAAVAVLTNAATPAYLLCPWSDF
jgi:predicted GNAT superfamily acetyltransferase